MRGGKILRFLVSFCYVLVLSLPNTGFTQTATSAQKLYGTWYTYPLGNPETDPVRREFRHNSATGNDELIVARRCAGNFRPAIVKAVSPIEVSEDTIRILKSASDSATAQNKSVCQVSIEAASVSYTLSEDGDRVTITNPGGNPDILELARQDAANEAALPKNLYGTWLLPPVSSKERRVQTRIVFYATADRQKVRQIATCSEGNDSAVSHVDSDISIGKDQITVMESASHTQQEGTFLCRSTIKAGTWRYTLAPDGLSLTISINGGKPLKLTREAQPGLD